MTARDELLGYVRDALNNLYDPNNLRASPLAEIFHIANQTDTPSTLRTILTQAIETLKPEPQLASSARAWRLHDALFYSYVQRFSQQDVADQLGLSSRQVRREIRSALESLVDCLWSQFSLADQARWSDPGAVRRTPVIDDELMWLHSSPTEKPVVVRQLLPDVVALVDNLAARYGCSFSLQLPESMPDVATNLTIVRQALLSVLTVAIHHAAQQKIALHANIEGPNVVVHVRARLPMQKAHLNIAQDSITVEMARQLFERCGGQLQTILGHEAFEAIIHLPAVAQIPVLVIDDNLDTLALIQRYVCDTRFRVVGSSDPEQVLDLVKEIAPRIILLDVMMPKIDGWELLGRLRQQPAAKAIAIIVCTVLPQQELAISLGAADYVAKPISRQALLSALDKHARSLDAAPR